jgi:hypothetical protein|eukprot:evm.model.NODE_16729_length_6257_cov_28.676363.2
MDKTALFSTSRLLYGGKSEMPHPDRLGENLPEKLVLHFVMKGNVYPEGRKDASDESATYIRVHAKQAKAGD